MNDSPHCHEVSIQDRNTYIRIQYGDQNGHHVYVRWPGWRSRCDRVLARMIRRHDRQSLKAGVRNAKILAMKEAVPLRDREGVWGSDVLTGTPVPPVPKKEMVLHPLATTGLYDCYVNGSIYLYNQTLKEAAQVAAERNFTVSVLESA